MNFYKVFNGDVERDLFPTYCQTQKDAHATAKGHPSGYDAVRVELVSIPTHASNVCLMLNREHPIGEVVTRTYKLTARGGMVECPNGE